MASAALICVCVPLSVSVALPLAPALIAAPPASVTLSVPWLTVSCVLARLPSTSLTLIGLPLALLKASAVSSLTVCAPGTVLTGASLVTVIVKLAACEVPPSPSLTVTAYVQVPEVAAVNFRYLTIFSAASGVASALNAMRRSAPFWPVRVGSTVPTATQELPSLSR